MGISKQISSRHVPPRHGHDGHDSQATNRLTSGLGGASRPRPDESFALLVPYNLDEALELLHILVQLVAEVLLVGEVVHQDDFVENVAGRSIDHRVNGTHQNGEALVVEDDDDTGLGQIVWIVPVAALLQPGVLNGSVHGDLVGAGDVHAVLHFGGICLVLLVLGQVVGLPILSRPGPGLQILWLKVSQACNEMEY